MKTNIIQHEFSYIFLQNDIFGDIFDITLEHLTIQTLKPDEYLIKQGSIVKSIFFICKGKLEVMKRVWTKRELFI